MPMTTSVVDVAQSPLDDRPRKRPRATAVRIPARPTRIDTDNARQIARFVFRRDRAIPPTERRSATGHSPESAAFKGGPAGSEGVPARNFARTRVA